MKVYARISRKQIQQEITERIDKIRKLQEEIYWLAKKRDRLPKDFE